MMRKAGVILAVASLMPLAACGGGSSGGSSGDQSANLTGRGAFSYVQGKDNSNVVRPLIEKWNSDPANKDQQVTFIEQSADANAQLEDLKQHFLAKSTDYDVVDVDVVWTAEFAANAWLQPYEGDFQLDTSAFIPATVDSGTYNGKLYAAPQTTDGGILYYRKDLFPKPPTSWDEMMADCPKAKADGIDCYAGQFQKYEGLTVNVAEAINTAGGTIVGEDGSTPTVDSPEAKQGLQQLVDAFKDGNIPADAIQFLETESLNDFETGNLAFLRNWPYAYSLLSGDAASKVKDTFAMAPLPGDGNGPGASSLGGHNLAISVFSEHKASAFDFVKFMTSEETEKFYITQGSLAPVVSSLYEDKALAKQFPYLPVLKQSLDSAVPRPITPYYQAVSTAIQDNAYAALKGDVSVDQALSDMSDAIKAASSGG
jgi:multiple sugar transport system substrate-binding protein